MSYYNRPMGDYRTGGYGYPQGDPGLFSILSKVIKPIWKVVRPALGGIIGGVIGGAAVQPGQEVAVPQPPAVPGAAAMPGGGLVPAAGALIGGAVAGFRAQTGAGGVCMAGYHPRKDKRLPFKCVRNRRMNIANPRALRRGIRRLKGFDKLARKSIRIIKRVR